MGFYFGPYVARLVRNKKQISYVGNKIFKPIKDVKKIKIKERKISELYSKKKLLLLNTQNRRYDI